MGEGLDKEGLKTAIRVLLKENSTSNINDTDQIEAINSSIESLAGGLANAIDIFVRSGKVETDVNVNSTTITTTVAVVSAPGTATGKGVGTGTGSGIGKIV